MTSGLSEGGRGDERVLIKCANVDSDLGGDFFFSFFFLKLVAQFFKLF